MIIRLPRRGQMSTQNEEKGVEAPKRQLILICGTRLGTNGAADVIKRILSKYDPETTTVLHGGAPGIDSISGQIASMMKFPVKIEYADWSRGPRGGPERNDRMLAMNPDHVYAIPDKKSIGTWDTINKARKKGIPTTVIDTWL